MGVSVSASAVSATERFEPLVDPDELLARAARAGPSGLRFLDLAPVLVIRGHDSASLEQLLEACRTGSIARASRGEAHGHLVGNFIAVGPVRSDRAGRTPPCPSDRKKPVSNAARLVDELAPLEWDIVDRQGRIADGADDEGGRNLVGFASAPCGSAFIEDRALDDDPLNLSIALDGHRLGEEIEDDPLGLVWLEVGEAAKQAYGLAQSRLQGLVGFNRWEVRQVDDWNRGFEMAELAQFLGSHGDLVRPAAAK